MFREIEDIVETLKNAKERGKKCSVLIGAGCSVTAGIPTAQGFVDIIKAKYPRDYERADQKTYPKCMGQLSIDEQRSLIVDFVDKAKINWGHIALAQLIKAGFIDRILTTNFDPLVMRACALVGLYPATYDLAASQHFEPDKVPDQAIFHLHGQRTGFILLNSEKVLEEHAEKLAPIFEDAGRGRVWLVVGYSGENDPVFDHLASTDSFDNKLYWVGYQDNEPAPHLRDRLLVENKYAFYTKGFDADSFFVTLAQMLGCFPPDFVSKPFSHLEDLFDNLTTYTFPKTKAPVNAMWYARNFVREAVEKIERVQSDVLQAWSDLLGGQSEKVIELQSKYRADMHSEVQDAIAWAYIMQGNASLNGAWEKNGEEADGLFKEAGEKYAEAVRIKPDKHDAFYNWGIALDAWSRTKSGEEADGLFREAGEKYAEAVRIKPDKHDAFYNWGNTLDAWAQTNTGEEADGLFREAGEKYAEAVRIKPDKHEAFNNWGNTLYAWARTKSGEEADRLFREAGEKYAEAVKIKPDKHEAFSNWGNALTTWAQTKSGEEADGLFQEAGEKCAEAVKIKPDDHDTFYNWGNTLDAWAQTKTGEEADGLFREAGEKYAEAVKIKPDKHEAFNNWGNTLYVWAQTKTGEEADGLFREAGEKYGEAVKIKPDKHETFSNWGKALYAWAQTKTGEVAHGLFRKAGEKYAESVKINPDKHETFYNWGNALYAWAQTKTGDEAHALFREAGEKYGEAVKIKPDMYDAFYNWGNALYAWAQTNTLEVAHGLFREAGEKYAESVKIKPDKHEAFNNWGSMLDAWARTKTGEEADALFEQADEKYMMSVKIAPGNVGALNGWGLMLLWWYRVVSDERKPQLLKQAEEILLQAESKEEGIGSYNLACVYSLLGDEPTCLKCLENSKKVGRLPGREHLERDPDLEPVRHKQWFKDFLTGLQ